MKLFFQRNLALALLLATANYAISSVASAQTAKAKIPSWVTVQAQTDKQKYVVGEPIKVTLNATNIHNRDAYIKYSSGQRFELKLFNDGTLRANIDEPIYTWSADKNFMAMVSHVKLKPGQSEVYRGEIGSEMGELAPGTYRLEAQLTNSSGIRAAPITFAVAAAAPGVTLSATTDKSVYKRYEKVNIDFTLKNSSDIPATFELRNWQDYDIVVRDSAGEIVWSWAADLVFLRWRSRNVARIMPLDEGTHRIMLNAGAKKDFLYQWGGYSLKYEPGKIPFGENTSIVYKPGKYTVEAIYASIPPVRAAPIEIEIQ